MELAEERCLRISIRGEHGPSTGSDAIYIYSNTNCVCHCDAVASKHHIQTPSTACLSIQAVDPSLYKRHTHPLLFLSFIVLLIHTHITPTLTFTLTLIMGFFSSREDEETWKVAHDEVNNSPHKVCRRHRYHYRPLPLLLTPSLG